MVILKENDCFLRFFVFPANLWYSTAKQGGWNAVKLSNNVSAGIEATTFTTALERLEYLSGRRLSNFHNGFLVFSGTWPFSHYRFLGCGRMTGVGKLYSGSVRLNRWVQKHNKSVSQAVYWSLVNVHIYVLHCIGVRTAAASSSQDSKSLYGPIHEQIHSGAQIRRITVPGTRYTPRTENGMLFAQR